MLKLTICANNFSPSILITAVLHQLHLNRGDMLNQNHQNCSPTLTRLSSLPGTMILNLLSRLWVTMQTMNL